MISNRNRLLFSMLLAAMMTAAPTWSQTPSAGDPPVQQGKPNQLPPPDSSEHSADKDSADNASSGDASSTDASAGASLPEGERFRVLGSSQLLNMQPGSLHVGPIFLSSVDLSFQYDNFVNTLGNQSIFRVGTLTGNLVFDKHFGQHNRLALQYHPAVYDTNGNFQSDVVSHSASLGGFYTLSPRWNLSASDHYVYQSELQQRLQDPGLSYDPKTGYVLSNRFLVTPGSFASNTSGVNLSYAAGELTTITLSPIANYVYTNQPGGLTGLQWGGMVGIGHRLSESRTVSLNYSAQRVDFVSSGPSSPQLFQNGWYHTIGATFSQSLGSRTFMSISGQANSVYEAGSIRWIGGGTFQFTKSFGNTAVGIYYTRSNQFLNTLRNGFGDQLEASVSRQLTQRFRGSISGGAYNGLWSVQPIKSYYGSASVSCHLFGDFFWRATYSYRKQSGDASTILIGREDLGSTGLQWIPGGRARD